MDVRLSSSAESKAKFAEELQCFSGLNLLHVKREVALLLQMIGGNGIFDEYTRHDISHIDAMLRLLTELIIPPQSQELMTAADWLMVVLSVYFHDLGMLVTKREYQRRADTEFPRFRQRLLADTRGKDYEQKLLRLPEDERERFLYQEFVRENHARRIRAWVTNSARGEFGIAAEVADAVDQILSPLDEVFRQDLGLVCESHHRDDLDDFGIYKTSQPYGMSRHETANLHYAALLLRTADLLHVSTDRTPSIVFKTISPTDPLSQLEWAKQMAVRSVRSQMGKDEEGADRDELPRDTIEVHALFSDENGFFGLTSYLDYAEKEIKQNHAWSQLSSRRKGVRLEFPWIKIDQRHIETKGFLKDQFEFTIDNFRILELLTGTTLYNDTDVVLRELVQNSIDAVRLAFFDKNRQKSREMGRVAIRWDSNNRTLIIIDNGTGMDHTIITENLLKVGSSRYQDPRFQEANPDFTPISRFGIGVLSAFMIADEVEYITYFAGEDHARRLLLRSVHGKYLVHLIEKNDVCVKHLLPHGTEVRVKVRHTATLNSIRDIARKWIIIPDCNVTVQVDDEPEEKVGFGSPKEALEDGLFKLGINHLGDGNRHIKINQEERNGVTLAYGVQWYEHFKEWNFMYPPTRGEDRESTNIVGTCVEGIRIDSATPGFTKPGLFAIANAAGRHAPRTNVARSDLDTSGGMSSLLHNVYSIYFDHIEDEMRQLQSARGFSRTWAAGEVKYLAMPFYNSRSYRDNEVRDVRARDEAAAAAAVLLVEREGERTLIPARQLREDEYFWTVDSAFFRSLEYVLREVPENASIDAIAKAIGGSRVGLPSGAILSNHSLGWLDLGFAGREVGEIVVNEEQRRADLRWVARSTPSRWRTPASIWPRVSRRVIENLQEWESSIRTRRVFSVFESRDRTNIASEAITLSGVGDWAFVETIGRLFWLPSPVQRFFAAINILENSQGIWDAYWTLYFIVQFGIQNFRDGLDAEATFDGQIEPRLGMLIRDLGRLQLDEFRSAIRECSWKRFSTNLWARDYDV